MSVLKQKLQKSQPKSQNKATGALGESIASSFLVNKGYTIVEKNATSRWGEIDIIARKPNGALVFVEVKCKIGINHGMPYESVTYGKLKRLSKTIQFYLLKNRISQSKLAIEVISIVLDKDHTITKINHFENIAIV
ncbi:YraN family protein [Candidatus Woesebacteria bacterium]|nr:YraN family protein [Candidatus Woesebacteria bacterium]